MPLVVKSYIEPSGQRNAVIVDQETGIPEFWPMLYCSSQLRARGNSHSTIKSHLRAIIYLYKWAEFRNLDIETRIKSAQGFTRNEVDTLITLLRSRISDLPEPSGNTSKIIDITSSRSKMGAIWEALEAQPKQVKAETYNERLDYVAVYIAWLSDYLSDQNLNSSRDRTKSIAQTGVEFKKVLTSMKSVETNKKFSSDKSIDHADIRSILELINPNNPENPWGSKGTRIRNFAIICILLDTGLRSGELLSLKLKDIIFGKKGSKGLKVSRRHGAKDDPRINQPSTKLGEREVPLSESSFKALDLYVKSVRAKTPQGAQSDYLFISLSNNTIGSPLSSVTSITNTIREITNIDITPHRLRHTATWRFCLLQKKHGKKWDEFVEQLILKFGWASVSSPSVRLYAKRFIKDELFEASIREQDSLNIEIEAASNAARMELGYE